jgi:membrane-associated phospholipid phosphatase
MSIELDIIRIIQSIRSGWLDSIMIILTELGDQLVFIALVAALYWFVDKKIAFKMTFAFIMSSITNELLKGVVGRNRPFVEDSSLGVGEPTSGYSFPSGHAQNIAAESTILYQNFNKKVKWLKWVLLALMIIVPLTRLYLGQHYLTDVIAGLILGVIVAYLFSIVVDKMGDKEHFWGLMVLIPLLIAVVVISFLGLPYDDIKNIYVAVGGVTGFMVGYVLDKFYIKYNEKPVKWKLLWRALVGIVGLAILYFGLSTLFKAIDQKNVYLDFIRYTLIGLWGSAGSMIVFKSLKV